MNTTYRGSSTRSAVRVPRQRSEPSPPVRAPAAGPRPAQTIPGLAAGLDILSLTLAAGLIAVLAPTSLAADATGGLVCLGSLVLWVGVIAVCGGYDDLAVSSSEGYRRVLTATVATTALTVLACYLVGYSLDRGSFVPLVLGGLALMLVTRAVLRRLLAAARRRGTMLRRVLLIGDEAHVDEFNIVLERDPSLGYQVIGALTNRVTHERTPEGVRILGAADEAAAMAASTNADLLLFTGGALSSSAELRRLSWSMQDSDARLAVAPSVTDIAPERIKMRPVGGVPLLHLDRPRATDAAKRGKRLFDIAGSLALLAMTAPLFLFAAFQIWRTDRGPIFFRHERIGRNGDPFGCWKFRTMSPDADERLADLLAEQGISGAIFAKLKDDPRITKPGRWLRRLSLDELPQLLNVLGGNMSLVGPRPQVAAEVAEYDEVMARRLHVKPGMTGLWQISGRSDLSVADSIRLDAYYVENWSLLRDVSILARTPIAVLTARGAY